MAPKTAKKFLWILEVYWYRANRICCGWCSAITVRSPTSVTGLPANPVFHGELTMSITQAHRALIESIPASRLKAFTRGNGQNDLRSAVRRWCSHDYQVTNTWVSSGSSRFVGVRKMRAYPSWDGSKFKLRLQPCTAHNNCLKDCVVGSPSSASGCKVNSIPDLSDW